jgi:hypothetical protein
MALREKDDTSSDSTSTSQKQILLSVSAAEPTSGMQSTLTRAERDPCDASHDCAAGGSSDLHPSFGWRTRVRQERVRCLTQTETGQALSEFGKVHRGLGRVRWACSTLTFLGGRDIRLRFAWHPCIASEKKFGRTSGFPVPSFKDDAEKTMIRCRAQFEAFRSTNSLTPKRLSFRMRLGCRAAEICSRCCATTPSPV